MREPTSYRDKEGNLIFAYCPETNNYTNWYVGRRRTSKDGGFIVSRIIDEGLRTWMTEAECRAALHRYAREHGLKPAY